MRDGRAPDRAPLDARASSPPPRPDPRMKEQLLKRLQDEIAVLDRELKSELPKAIQRAREFGDLRENAEYKAA